MIRFVACGSVDDGKSTLIGRLLYESNSVYEDDLHKLVSESKRFGTTGNEPDLAMLLDGLQAEREQSITIDVAYRHLRTNRQRFLIADAPGHEQYTRNMVTGASTAHGALILIDALRGVKRQTRRHITIAHLMGIKQLIVAINKMDLVDYDAATFDIRVAEYNAFAKTLGLPTASFVPVSALRGDNITSRSERMPWYRGDSLLSVLEAIVPVRQEPPQKLRFPVQLVNRPNSNFRGYSGTIVSGTINRGDEVMVLPSRLSARVKEIVTYDGSPASASEGQAVTITLEGDVDISRGELIVHPASAPSVGNAFEAMLVWLHGAALVIGASYDLKIYTRTVRCWVQKVHYKVDVDIATTGVADRLALNEIGACTLRLNEEVAYDTYSSIPPTGSFILVDRSSNSTVAAGMIRRGIQDATHPSLTNINWHEPKVSKRLRASQKQQEPFVVWLTGLSGSGKSTIANALEARLIQFGYHTYLLDGDNVRHGLNKDLTFSDADRSENIRRIAETVNLFVDAGLIVIAAFVSPFRRDRNLVRETVADGEFIEVYVDAPLEVCKRRDPKGLYEKASEGLITNFTGIDSPYEPPISPELTVRTAVMSVEECVEEIVRRTLRLATKERA